MARVAFICFWTIAVSGCQLFIRDPAAFQPLPEPRVPPETVGVAYERFMVLGDMGTGGAGQRKIAAAMAARAQIDGLDFILTVGDNFYPNGVESVDDPQWQTKFLDIYDDPALDVPVYASLGNHDHGGNAAAQTEYSRRNDRWVLPEPYYSFRRTLSDGAVVQFFALDTDPIHRGFDSAEGQLQWLDTQLGEAVADWKIVFGHHPAFSHGPHGSSDALRERVQPLLTKHGVALFLCGHDHTLELLKPIGGVHHVVTGGGGGWDNPYPIAWTEDAFYAATGGGFVLVRISRGELVVEFVRDDAKTEYAHVLSK